jgi:flagellar motor protein MotB
MAKRKQAHAGGHGWFVTFADLMGLLVSFFVMLVAFSNQDQKKLQIVAGSMRDAFGVQTNVRYSGVIEVDGLPTRPKLKNAAHIDPDEASATPTTDEQDHKREHGAHRKNDQAFALAAASLRQALQDMPELTEASKHIMIEESKEGLKHQPGRPGRSLDVRGRLQGALRAHASHHRQARRAAAGDALPGRGDRPYLGVQSAPQGGLRSLGLVGGSRQRRAPNPGRGGSAGGEDLRRRRKGRYRSAFPRGPLYCGQSPGDHYAHARGSAGSSRPAAVIFNRLRPYRQHPVVIVIAFATKDCV